VNGRRVKDKVMLKVGDEIAIPSSASSTGSGDEGHVAAFVWQEIGSPLPDAKTSSSGQALGTVLGSVATLAGGYGSMPTAANMQTAGTLPTMAGGAWPTMSGGTPPTAGYANSSYHPLPGRQGLPVFEVHCISALGISTAELGFLSKEKRIWWPEVGTTKLRVGRVIQPVAWWNELIRDERCRNSISREQFEVVMEGEGCFFIMPLGSTPTMVNGLTINARSRLQPMDVIGIGASATDRTIPVLRFQFTLETGNVLASVCEDFPVPT
jgi:pSer/pThr/pTyr-binding forkhead associated (FHA) protein